MGENLPVKKMLVFWVLLFCFIFLNQSLLASGWIIKNFKGMTGGIKILVNDVPIKTGIEPFILLDEGVTMVPLRDLSQALGFDVEWNNITNTISITGDSLDKLSIWDSKIKKKITDIKVIRNVGPYYEKKVNNYQIAGRSFNSGIAVSIIDRGKTELVLDLNRKYQSLDGYFGIEDETMNSSGGYILRIFGDDREVFVSELVKPSDYPRYISPGEIDLAFIYRLTIRMEWEELETGDYDNLTAVLANFNFYEK